MSFDVILFDLDGTLTQPFEGITGSVAYALEKIGIKVKDRRTLTSFIGPPLADAFEEFYGFGREDALKAVGYYRENYSAKGIYEAEVYDGVREMLKGCLDAGKTIAVATAKPEEFAIKVLERFDLLRYFRIVAGASFDESRKDKDKVIAYAIERLKIKDKSKVLMVGDRKHDVEGAAVNGIKCLGVVYGYGSRGELEKSGAAFIADSPQQALKIILG